MARCLMAPSHYLNQCWLIIRGVLWYSENSFAGIAQGINSGYEFEKDILKIIFKSPRGQWVNPLCAELFWRNRNMYLHIIYTSLKCHGVVSWTPHLWKPSTHLWYTVNTKAVMQTQGISSHNVDLVCPQKSSPTWSGLTHWGRDKMAAISQTTFSSEFSWMKMYEFRLRFQWSLFLGVQATISQHWFR